MLLSYSNLTPKTLQVFCLVQTGIYRTEYFLFYFWKGYLKVTIPSTDYDRSKTKGEYGVFRLFWVPWYQMVQDVHMDFNPGMSWWKKKTLNKKKALFANRLQLNLKRELVKCYTWSIALYSTERWALRKVNYKYMWSFGMWCWTVTEEITWTDRVKNKVAITQS